MCCCSLWPTLVTTIAVAAAFAIDIALCRQFDADEFGLMGAMDDEQMRQMGGGGGGGGFGAAGGYAPLSPRFWSDWQRSFNAQMSDMQKQLSSMPLPTHKQPARSFSFMSSSSRTGDGGDEGGGGIVRSSLQQSSMSSSSSDGGPGTFQYSSSGSGGPVGGGGQWRKYGEKLYINENGDVQNFGGGEVSSVSENGRKAVFYNGRKVWSNDDNGGGH